MVAVTPWGLLGSLKPHTVEGAMLSLAARGMEVKIEAVRDWKAGVIKFRAATRGGPRDFSCMSNNSPLEAILRLHQHLIATTKEGA